MRFMRPIILAIACLLPACSLPTKPSLDASPSPLVLASCPAPTPLSDDSMGALLSKVIDLGNTYRECRAAALAGQPASSVDYSLGSKLRSP